MARLVWTFKSSINHYLEINIYGKSIFLLIELVRVRSFKLFLHAKINISNITINYYITFILHNCVVSYLIVSEIPMHETI